MATNIDDFEHFTVSEELANEVYVRRLSYPKARAELNQHLKPMDASGKRYATTILFVEQHGSPSPFDGTVPVIRRRFEAEIRRLDRVASPWGNDDSWIWWDLAKQYTLFLSKDRSGTSERYRIADPFSDTQLQEEIISRHIGWELWYAYPTIEELWVDSPEVRRLLGPDCVSSKHPPQPASWALTRLGAMARSASAQAEIAIVREPSREY